MSSNQSGAYHRRRPVRRGAAAVEFAILVPFLAVLAIGMIEVTRAVQVKEVLTDAVRSSCRLAIQPAATNAAVKANINQILTGAGITASYATITIQVNGKAVDVATAVQGDQISVRVGLPLAQVGYVTPMFFTTQNVESETLIMMRQG